MAQPIPKDQYPLPSSAQIRAARSLLGLSQAEVAGATGLSIPTVKRAEADQSRLKASLASIDQIARALEAAGVEFTNGDAPGVKLRKAKDQ